MGQKEIIRLWWESGFCLYPGTISPLFADFSSTTRVYDCVTW